MATSGQLVSDEDINLFDELLGAEEKVQAYADTHVDINGQSNSRQQPGASASTGDADPQQDGVEGSDDDGRVFVTKLPSPERYWQQQRQLMACWAGVSAGNLLLQACTFWALSGSLPAALESATVMGMAAWVCLLGPAVYFAKQRPAAGGGVRRPASALMVLGGMGCFASAGMGFVFLFGAVGHLLMVGQADDKGVAYYLLGITGLMALVMVHVAEFMISITAVLRARTVIKLLDPVSSGIVTF